MLADLIAEELGEAGTEVVDNPFLSEQLILCSTAFLEGCDIDTLAAAEWDLVVEKPTIWSGPGRAVEAYQRVERLARTSPGLCCSPPRRNSWA